MADNLASIYGTEKDKVNCPFYYKIGACRHGDRCSRQHHKPLFSQTILLANMYQNPLLTLPQDQQYNHEQLRACQKHFDDFYEDVYNELSSFGELDEVQVCDNLCDHLVGNVYAKFEEEDDAAKALQTLHGRFYAGRPIVAEFSPVTDFREARCRQYEMSECTRGGHCNFMHLKQISRDLARDLFRNKRRRHSRSRSRSPDLEARGGGGGGGGRGGGYRGGGGGGGGRGGDPDRRRGPIGPAYDRERDRQERRHSGRDRDDRRRSRSRSPRRERRRSPDEGRDRDEHRDDHRDKRPRDEHY